MTTQYPQPVEPSQAQQGTQEPPEFGLSRKQKDAFPELYGTAAKSARLAQKRYYRLLGWELIAVFVAAFAQFALHPFGAQIADLLHFKLGDIHFFMIDVPSATLSSAIAGSFVSIVAVVVVIGLTVLRYWLRLDEKWHERRSLAEAVKGLTWRYSMRALPGDLPGAATETPSGDDEYASAYEMLNKSSLKMDLPPATKSRPIITEPMRHLRQDANWTEKRTAYLRDRIDDQLHFYLGQANKYHRSRNRLRGMMIACYIVGGLLLPINGLGALTTAAGVLGTWLGAKHYSDLSQSYSAMQRELEVFRTKATNISPDDPDDLAAAAKWSQLVNEVETRLDGEHQDWLKLLGD